MRGAVALVAAFAIAFSATEASATPPPGATAKCRDATYSYSHHRRGTCSHHGGVATWLRVVAP